MSRVTANGTAGKGPAWFRLEDKSGLIYEYGNSDDSRIESLAVGSLTTALYWALNKIEDRYGNEIVFNYTEDGAPYGDYRIDTITYRRNPSQSVLSGYTVKFNYEDHPVGDVDTESAAGGTVEDTKRLDTIDVWHGDPDTGDLYRRYDLKYESTLASTGRSRIEEVKECAGSPLVCLSPSSFTYLDGTDDLETEVSSGTTLASGDTLLSLDINGDGRMDIAYSDGSTGMWHYQLGNSTGTYNTAQNSGVDSTNHDEAIVIDYNSDGLEDILVPYNHGRWHAILGTSTGLANTADDTGTNDESRPGDAVAFDWNGDGRDDLIWADGPGTGPGGGLDIVKVRLRDTVNGGFESVASIVFSNGGEIWGPRAFTRFKQDRRRHFDVNGDGLGDLAIVVRQGNPGNRTFESTVILGNGLGVFAAHSGTSVPKGLPMDLNGDGYTDIVFDDSLGYIKVRVSTGKTFGVVETGPSTTNRDFGKAAVVDWNSDGFDDLLIPNTSFNVWRYLLSDGENLADEDDTAISSSNVSSAYSLDVNGDGLDDIGFLDTNGTYKHHIHSGVLPDLMETATDGYGNSITFNYGSIVAGSYSKFSGNPFPDVDYVGPFTVVTSAEPTTGILSDTFTLTYTYAGLRLNLEGRGLSPFSSMTTVDSRTGIKSVATFHRLFPYRGRLFKTETKQSNDTLIQETAYTWAKLTGGTGTNDYHFPYLQKAIAKSFEVGGTYDGSQISEVTTTVNTIDSYGVATKITTETEEKATANGVQSGAKYTEILEHTSVTNNATTWCIGKPTNTEFRNSHTESHGTQIVRTVSRTWDTATYCHQTQEVVEPGDVDYEVTRDIGYDNFGNIDDITITGVGMAARTTEVYYGATGHLPLTITNALGHDTTITWDYEKGVQLSVTDPNGLVSSWLYDDFARRARATAVDGTYTIYSLLSCNAGNSYCGTSHDRIVTKVNATLLDNLGAIIRADDTFLDKADRPVQAEGQLLNGAVSKQRTQYDALGRVSKVSAPTFDTTTLYNTTTDYDILGRPTKVSRQVSLSDTSIQETTIDYEGLTVTTLDPEGSESTKVSDALGRVHRSIDDNGYYQQFEYDSFSSLKEVIDSSSNILMSASYDYGIAAFRVASDDMDMGAWTYTPNALGEVVGHTDAKLQTFSATFDKLGRPLTRTEPDNKTIWTWGTSAVENNIGRLDTVCVTDQATCNNIHSESYEYDSNGRLEQRTIVSDATYEIDYAYHSSTGLLEKLTYPETTSGFRLKVKYEYAYGILEKVSDFDNPSTTYWEATSVDSRGNVIDETLGNGMETIRGYDPVNGLLDYIQSGIGGGHDRQDLTYNWNKVGSLTQRKDVDRNLTEDFYYDSLHRLDYSKLNNDPTPNLDLAYDDMGNITYKSDVSGSNWTYHVDKKHAVVTAGSNSYTYDGNGNMATRDGDPITWSSYNYPTKIVDGSRTNEFSYDANRQKWKQKYTIGSNVETTYFVGGIFEKNVHSGGTDYRHYISANGNAIAMLTRVGTTNTVRYFTYDHMGSIDEISNSNGTTYVNQSFAAFGERRDPTDWDGSPPAADIFAIADATDQGYTGHLNMINTSLVHMNGRVADAETGRFLSADPFVAHPDLTQSYNRYSYVYNDPLTFTDPSGFCVEACVTFTIFITLEDIGDLIFSLFGSKKTPKPRPGCYTGSSAGSCFGAASPPKTFKVNSDIFERLFDLYDCYRKLGSGCLAGPQGLGIPGFGGLPTGVGGGRVTLPGGVTVPEGFVLNVVPDNSADTIDDAVIRADSHAQRIRLNLLRDRLVRWRSARRNRFDVNRSGKDPADSSFGGVILLEDPWFDDPYYTFPIRIDGRGSENLDIEFAFYLGSGNGATAARNRIPGNTKALYINLGHMLALEPDEWKFVSGVYEDLPIYVRFQENVFRFTSQTQCIFLGEGANCDAQ